MQKALLTRFLRYVQSDTQSDPNSLSIPSSPGQKVFAATLKQELLELGFSDVFLSDACCLYARVPATIADIPVIGFIAHLDTSPDYSGANVKPQIIPDYQGQIIALGDKEQLSPEQFPDLLHYLGKTLITADGSTLLGADDKAGIAAIITAMHYLLQHPEIPHGEIAVCFTPDEEIGRGVKGFDLEHFAAQWAYTVDGGAVGELQFENFNAATAVITARGNACHPGSAFGVMVNAMTMACRFHAKMPLHDTPEHSSGYEGFFHLVSMEGTTEQAKLVYLIRDFDKVQFEQRKQWLQDLVQKYNDELTSGSLEIAISDSYFNMKEAVMPTPHVINIACRAMEMAGVTPDIKAIRGGTDGAQLSYRGLPCPNLFAGGHNFHGKHEYVCLESMEQAVAVIINIAKLTTQRYD
ncbi:peptidase T [Shewanella yunxiaonensis]|uniref:Peptidase T n=1 Tax=Shewanella yunxiaonensis TaxID=2829809 RepID=A0ABX7YVI2_9GAMM|nr:peptidase T [Shewanella yunxiaonensis]QUN06350.1 peptidase T [Shewanella yunxiaonensis]